MRKLILFLIIGIFLMGVVNAAENCELAVPRYGILQCADIGDKSATISLTSNGEYSEGSFTCYTKCEIANLPVLNCAWLTTGHWEIKIDGSLVYQKSSTGDIKGDLPIIFNRGQTISIIGYCRNALLQKTPLTLDSIPFTQRKWMIQEGWAGSLPTTQVPNTEGCALNKVVDKYKGDTDISSFLNPSSGKTENKPSATYSAGSEMPPNWDVGQNYIFVKDWQTGIADISLAYDKNNKGYWCGGVSGSRKIYAVNEVTSKSGKCYAIPTSIALSNVECCFPADCSWKGSEYTCNPDDWKCEETKPCNSQLECDQTFGEGVCENSQITKWTCDVNKKWGDYSGTCVKSSKKVDQCPSDCTTDEYYNEEEGKCKPRNVLLNCPANKCCLAGGSYKEKSCSSGQQCCTSGGYVGACAPDCSKQNQKDSLQSSESGITGNVIGGGGGGSWIIYVIFAVIIIGGIVGFLIYRNKTGKRGSLVSRQGGGNTGTSCKKCGSPLKPNSQFCTNCGGKVDKFSDGENIVCKNCGNSNSHWRKFCTKCGKSLTEN